MKKNSIKNTRINQEVQKVLSNLILLEVKDPRIAPMTSVSDENVKKETIKGLKSAAPFLRSGLAKTLNLRNTPELRFCLDESLEYGMHMNELIASLHKPEEEREENE